jgi:transposase
MRLPLETRTLRAAVVVVRLSLRGDPHYLLVRSGRLDGWSLVSGALRSDEHPDWHRAAVRGCEQKLAPLRFAVDFFLVPLSDRPLRWTSRSAAGVKTTYQTQVFGARFVRDPDECRSRLPTGAYRLVADAELSQFHDDVLSAVVAAVPDAPLSWETGPEAARSTPGQMKSGQMRAARAGGSDGTPPRPAKPRPQLAAARPRQAPPPRPTSNAKPADSRGRWTPETIARLGVDTDTEIAADLQVTVSAVAQRRRALGIPRSPGAALQPRVWSAAEDRVLGTASDREVAEQLGVSVETVERRRVHLGVEAFNAVSTRRDPRKLSGARYLAAVRAKVPIADIAREHGISAATVRKALQRYNARELSESGDKPRRR